MSCQAVSSNRSEEHTSELQSRNLDSKTSQDVCGLLKITSERFCQTILLITHNEEIAQLAERIIRIEDGRIVEEKTKRQVNQLA